MHQFAVTFLKSLIFINIRLVNSEVDYLSSKQSLAILVFFLIFFVQGVSSYDSTCGIQITGNSANCDSAAGPNCGLEADKQYTATITTTNTIPAQQWDPACDADGDGSCVGEFSLQTWAQPSAISTYFNSITPALKNPNGAALVLGTQSGDTYTNTFTFGTTNPTTGNASWQFQTTGNGLQKSSPNKTAIYFLIDASGSINDSDMTKLKNGVKNFVDIAQTTFNGKNDLRIGVMIFGANVSSFRMTTQAVTNITRDLDSGNEGLVLVTATSKNSIKLMIDTQIPAFSARSAYTTPLGQALDVAHDKFYKVDTLRGTGVGPLNGWDKIVILVSDGGPKCDTGLQTYSTNITPTGVWLFDDDFCGDTGVCAPPPPPSRRNCPVEGALYSNDRSNSMRDQGVSIYSMGVGEFLDCSELQNVSASQSCDSQGTSGCFCGISFDDFNNKMSDVLQRITTIGSFGTACTLNFEITGAVPVCNNNGVQDNGETGIDCGGGGCPACSISPATLDNIYIGGFSVTPSQITAGDNLDFDLNIAWQGLGAPFKDIEYNITLVRIGAPESPQTMSTGEILGTSLSASSGEREFTNEIITAADFPSGSYRVTALVYYGNDPKPVDLASRIIFIGKRSTPIPDLNGAAIVLIVLAAFFILKRNN